MTAQVEGVRAAGASPALTEEARSGRVRGGTATRESRWRRTFRDARGVSAPERYERGGSLPEQESGSRAAGCRSHPATATAARRGWRWYAVVGGSGGQTTRSGVRPAVVHPN